MIKIESLEDYTQFYSGNMLYTTTSYLKCDICKTRNLSSIYLRIIKMLEKADLLPENFVKMCCICFIIKKELGFNYCKKCDGLIVPFATKCSKSFIGTSRQYTTEDSFIRHLECSKCAKIYKRILYSNGKRVLGSTCPI